MGTRGPISKTKKAKAVAAPADEAKALPPAPKFLREAARLRYEWCRSECGVPNGHLTLSNYPVVLMWAQAMGRADELEPEIQEGGLSLIGPKGGEYLNPKYTAQCAELGRAERLAKALLITPESQLRSAGATEPAKEPEDVITTLREKNIRDRMSR